MFSRPIKQEVQELKSQLLQDYNIRLFVQREDLNDPACLGNKWWKLRYNLQEAIRQKKNSILTFGGAYSNHISATASVCRRMGLQSIGVIRGEHTIALNPTLIQARNDGMKLHFVDRETYRRKHLIDWSSTFGDCFVIPEGGTNELAVSSCEEMLYFKDFDILCVPIGTGGTFSGLIRGLSDAQMGIGFSSLRGGDFLNDEVKKYVSSENWSIQLDYHFGGYAKINEELVHFMNDFKRNYSIQLDPIYTAKMFYGIFDMIKDEKIDPNSIILAIHTGGLQGIKGMNERLESKGWKID